LNASDYSTASITSDTAYGDFTVLATSSKAVAIVSGYSTTYDGTTYTNAFDLKGGADGPAPTYRAIKFTASAGATISAIVNANSSRTLQLSDGSSVVASGSVSSTTSEFSYTTTESGTFYLYSKSSALRVYAVSVSGTESSFETIELNANDLTHGTFTSNSTSGSFTIYATSSKTVSVPYITSTTFNGTTFTQTLALGGGGSAGSYRCAGFEAVSGCTVTAYAYGASGRYLALVDSTGTVVSKQEVSSSLASYSYTVPSDGTYYVMSTGSGINICYLNVSN
uniref:hypothetical protein n=1 Tax=Treponema sp. TaxID=166 RepID=UPI00389101DC